MPDYNTKYRPQTIADLDLKAVREGLEQVLKSENIPHAFLFCGPRGTGKTSAARIVAKAVNCVGREKEGENPSTSLRIKDFEPCNKCEQCLSITSGNNLDVLEIDAASNRGIDDIRELRDKIKLAPSSAKYKIYIIDEVHMLTLEAFNALLKTLEEPPSHAIFILCTTDPEKLPETIISRCMRFNFKRATPDEIKSRILKIKALEKFEVEDNAMGEIAKAATGSFRDAQKILERASFLGKTITKDDIEEIIGKTTGTKPVNLLNLLYLGNLETSLKEIERIMELGTNLRLYTQDLLELLRIGMLESLGIVQTNTALNEENSKILKQFSLEEIKDLILIFSQAYKELKETVIPQLPLEMAVIEWCLKKSNGNKTVKKEIFAEQKVEEKPEKEEAAKVVMADASVVDFQNHWQDILLGVRPKNHSVEALLRATRPLNFADGTLTLEVFYQFHKDQLETEKCRRIVEEITSLIIGKPVKLKCVLGHKPHAAPIEIKTNIAQNFDEPDLIKMAEDIFSGTVN
jgi:DNA polymerase III subunit gamma/tau